MVQEGAAQNKHELMLQAGAAHQFFFSEIHTEIWKTSNRQTAAERQWNNLKASINFHLENYEAGPDSGPGCAISSGRVFMINTPAQCKFLHTWIILVNVKQYLVQIGPIDGQTEYLS